MDTAGTGRSDQHVATNRQYKFVDTKDLSWPIETENRRQVESDEKLVRCLEEEEEEEVK